MKSFRYNHFLTMISVAAILAFAGPAFAEVSSTAHDTGIGQAGVCSACHLPHGAAGERLWPANMGGQEVSYGVVGSLCFYCHGTGGGAGLADAVQILVLTAGNLSHGRDVADLPAGDAMDATLPHGGDLVEIECTTCHNVHDDTYKPFLQDDIDILCARCHTGRLFVDGSTPDPLAQGTWGDNYGTGNPGSHPVGTDVNDDTDGPGSADSPITMAAVFESAYNTGGLGTHNLGGHLMDGGTEAGGAGVTCVTCHSVHGIQLDSAHPGGATPAVENLLTIAQPTAGGAYLGGVYNGNGDATNALCEGCHGTTAIAGATIDPSTGSNYGGSEKINPGVETYTHPVDDLGADADAGVSGFPTNWPSGSTPGTNVAPDGPICESCHTPHPNANVARSTIIDGSGTPILRAVSSTLCAECHGGGAGGHHPSNVPMGTLSDPAVEDGDGTLNCNDCHGGAPQNAHNWTGPGAFKLDPDWEPNSTGGVIFSDNGQADEATDKRFVPNSSKECMDCHLSAGPNPAPYVHDGPTGSETEYGEYQDTGDASHYLGDTNAAAITYANGNCPDGTVFNATTTDWPGGGWSRFDSTGINKIVCESCHELQSSKNVPGTALLLHRFIEGDPSPGVGDYASELCEGCHGANPGGKTHPMTGDIVDMTGLELDSTSNDPPAANPPSGNATYPAGTGADSLNCDSCHQPHDADTNGGTYILEDNVTGTANGDTRGSAIPDLSYMLFCKDCHTNH